MKKRFTDEQIIGFLREAEAGVAVKDLCRKHGFSEASYYLWRSKFGGMSVPDAKRLRELETENARLKMSPSQTIRPQRLLAEKGKIRLAVLMSPNPLHQSNPLYPPHHRHLSKWCLLWNKRLLSTLLLSKTLLCQQRLR